MLRFLGILVLLVAGVACLGLYLGWFSIGSDSADGKTHINLIVDKNKINADEQKVLKKLPGGGN
jgi:hypothetical protein